MMGSYLKFPGLSCELHESVCTPTTDNVVQHPEPLLKGSHGTKAKNHSLVTCKGCTPGTCAPPKMGGAASEIGHCCRQSSLTTPIPLRHWWRLQMVANWRSPPPPPALPPTQLAVLHVVAALHSPLDPTSTPWVVAVGSPHSAHHHSAPPTSYERHQSFIFLNACI